MNFKTSHTDLNEYQDPLQLEDFKQDRLSLFSHWLEGKR